MTKTLLSGLMIGESPRWHDGRLWFSNWGSGDIIAVDPGGAADVVATVPTTIPYSIDWLGDDLLVVSGPEATVLHQVGGTFTTFADLSPLMTGCNEIVVDGRGNTYVNGFAETGVVAVLDSAGAARLVADGIDFPNGMVVTPDNSTLIIAESMASRLTAFDIDADGSLSNRRVWAELGSGGDGITMDAEGAVWSSATIDGQPCCVRVAEGGAILDRIDLGQGCFACMLGGADGRTLFMLVADWYGFDRIAELVAARTGKLLSASAPVQGTGWPRQHQDAVAELGESQLRPHAR